MGLLTRKRLLDAAAVAACLTLWTASLTAPALLSARVPARAADLPLSVGDVVSRTRPVEKMDSRFESRQSRRTQSKRDRYYWYELTDEQDAALRAALKMAPIRGTLLVMSATPDSLELAKDFDSAFRDAGLKSQLDRPMDVVDGLHTNWQPMKRIIEGSTGIHVTYDPPDPPTSFVDPIVLNFGRKVAK